MKILIIKFRNIGDVLLTTPLVANLKALYPDAEIHFALNKGTEAMVAHHPDIARLHLYDREKIRRLPPLRRIAKELAYARAIRRVKFDMVINTTEGDRGAQLAWISGAAVKIGYPPKKNRLLKNVFTHTLPPQGMRHTVETNLDPIRVLERPVTTKRVSMHYPDKAARSVEDFLVSRGLQPGAYIHFHPVSRWLFKCLDDKTAAAIIDFCQQTLPVVVTAAPVEAERKKIASILAHCQSDPIDLSGRLSLEETAALSDRARFFVGVDTAVMHMAAALDTPVLAFFGPSGAFHWGPWDNDRDESGYTRRSGVQRMGRHRVLALDWECIPCGQDGCEGSKVSDCLVQMPWLLIQNHLKEMFDDTHS